MKLTVKQAFDEAYSEITSKGYMTDASRNFNEGNYIGYLYLSKRATWKSPISIVFKVRKKWRKKLLIKEDKKLFMETVVIGTGVPSGTVRPVKPA